MRLFGILKYIVGPFFCGMENAKACASAALRVGEKSLKCIGFLDGKGVIC